MFLTLRGGSAAGPKPGRVSFYVELDGAGSGIDGFCYCFTSERSYGDWAIEPPCWT